MSNFPISSQSATPPRPPLAERAAAMVELRRGAAIRFGGDLAALAVDGLTEESLQGLLALTQTEEGSAAEGSAAEGGAAAERLRSSCTVTLFLSEHRAQFLGMVNANTNTSINNRQLSWNLSHDTDWRAQLGTILALALPTSVPSEGVGGDLGRGLASESGTSDSGSIAAIDPRVSFTTAEGHSVERLLDLAIEARLLPALLVVRFEPKTKQPPAALARLYALSEEALNWSPHRDPSAQNRVTLVSRAKIPLAHPEVSQPIPAEFLSFRPSSGGCDQIAVIIGAPNLALPVTVRLHSSCMTGDLFGSMRCDCGEQLHAAIARLHNSGGGVILYLHQEGRGIGISNKLRAYRLQEQGFDTLEANLQLGFNADLRDYHSAVAMLRTMGISSIRLLSNSPSKEGFLEYLGMPVIERLNHSFPANPHNRNYLQTKKLRAGHNIV